MFSWHHRVTFQKRLNYGEGSPMKKCYLIVLTTFFLSLGGCATINGIGEDISNGMTKAKELGMGKSCTNLPEGRLCWDKKAGCPKDNTRQLRAENGSLSYAEADLCPLPAETGSEEEEGTTLTCYVFDQGKGELCYQDRLGCRDSAERIVYWGIQQSDGGFKGFDKNPQDVGPEYCSLVEK